MDVEDLTSSILTVLKEIEEEKARDLANFLYGKGLRSEARLKLVSVEDCTDYIDLYDARELVNAWSTQPDRIPTQRDVNQHGRQRAMNREPEPSTSRQSRAWEFDLNWQDIYHVSKDLRQKMKAGKKLSKTAKREIIKRIVNQVKETVPHAERSIFIQIAGDLKTKYPVTFVSELREGKVNKKSLCFKMQTKFDNSKRPARKTTLEKEAPAIKAAYGCKKWRLQDIPEGHTAASLENLRLEMEDYYEQTRPQAWNMEYIDEAMDKTYYLLRIDINKQAELLLKVQKKKKTQQEENIDDPEIATTEKLRDKWPFLFLSGGMMKHFLKLTEVDFKEKLEVFLNGSASKFLDFLFETTKGKLKKIKKQFKKDAERDEDGSKIPELVTILTLLTKRFKEDLSALWQMVPGHVRENDVKTSCEIPRTPCLIIAGNSCFDTQNLFFTMDGTVQGTAADMKEGIAMVFTAYYVFNIEYAATAQVTLEFIQRIIADINPPRLNKRPKKDAGGNYCSRMVHEKLRQMNDKYDQFFDEKDSESESGESVV